MSIDSEYPQAINSEYPRTLGASGLLATFNELGVIDWGDFHTATKIAFLFDETDESVMLALALSVNALQSGSTCLELATVATTSWTRGEDAVAVPVELWPQLPAWIEAITASAMVTLGDSAASERPLRYVDGLLYLERYWQEECNVARELAVRRQSFAKLYSPQAAQWFEEVFATADQYQSLAGAVAAHAGISVIAGGPGTGKSATIARIVALLIGDDPELRIALTAPTGRAAKRMEEVFAEMVTMLPPQIHEAVSAFSASTLHRLLGWTPLGSGFRHNRENPLPYDVVIVDEASMVSLVMMSKLLAALSPDSRLILVGDPNQLAPVEAGAVLADIVASPGKAPTALPAALDSFRLPASGTLVTLQQNHRFQSDIAGLAQAVLDADDVAVFDAVSAGENIHFYPDIAASDLHEKTLRNAREIYQAAQDGDAPNALARLETHRVLCAHRSGVFGVSGLNRRIEDWLAAAHLRSAGNRYLGQPLLVTQNSPELGIYNGDTGIFMGDGKAWFAQGDSCRGIPVELLGDVLNAHAITVHKAQGSQFQSVTLILPPAGSPLLTRELLYTAITRARSEICIIGSEESLRYAVTHRAQRASGLSRLL